ncbi:TPA: ead/Ea22-like family protein [Escherichia coli]|uniref:ead/Ea22-like family protein n=1 Tax=Escherichia coli TaxID=562 RepID=UPI000BE9E539|nr:ead/Ea22-like family protein [Escherichia coli]EFA3976201.1 ead/Ea22-like family protein [Escherichia coli]EFC0794892.1 ead/Ea22-like family protein [Escherichia coli]EFE8096194.1 ead/Ea22-like family protein [Escherichia coli]EFJ3310777.1 ead/Ea22-like family protein [Escherichia coli]EFJ3473573.1 ead/Ea22-like family protein [Escherichia coli]
MSEINYQALREAAQNYQSTLAWYEAITDNPNAEQDCSEAVAAFKRQIRHQEMDIIAELLDEREAQNKRIAELEANLAVLAAENAGLKSNLIYWGGEASEPVRSPLDYAHEAGLESGEEFEMQVAARMPNLTYRVVSSSRFRTEIELVGGLLPETPATNAFLAEVRAQGVEMFAECAYTLEHHDHAVAFATELRKGDKQ